MTNSEKDHSMNRMVIKWVVVCAMCLAGAFAIAADAATEDQLIAVLKSDAGWQEKYTACTQLRQIGTAKSVPALASLLNDEKLSHMARYALEPMPFPEATDALRKAVGKTKGLQKSGVISSLGVKRDPKAVKVVAKALKDKDPAIAGAAAGALGRIGTVPAAAVLTKFEKSAGDDVRDAVIDGLLSAAEHLTKEGNAKVAIAIGNAMMAAPDSHARLGGFRVLVHADPAAAPALIAKALGGDDAEFREFAAQAVAEAPGPELTAAFAAALPTLPPAGQAALVRGLGERKDPAGRAAVVSALASGDKAVKLASIRALGSVGTPEDVAALSALLADGDAEIVAATKKALATMKSKDIDGAIAAALPSVAPAVRAQLLDVQSERMSPQAVASSVQALADPDMAVRVSALKALTKMGSAAEAPAVIDVLKKTTDASERSDASDALNAISSENGDAVLPVVLEAMNGANADSQVALLSSLGRIGTTAALDSTVKSLAAKDTAVRDAAVRVLAGWPSTEAAPHLLKLAQGKVAAHKDAALRGYVRLAQAEGNVDVKTQMLTAAMGVAQKPEEKWLVLPAWGALPTKQSLDTLVPLLSDPGVKNEAATALITAATAMAKADPAQKPVAAEAVKAVAEKIEDAAIKERATKTLETLK